MTTEDPVASPMNELALSEEAFFFDLSLDLLSVIGLDGYFKRINPAFTQTLGYCEAEFLASPFLDFVHPDDHAATLAEMEKLNTGVPTLDFENRYRNKDGGYRWLVWTASPQVDRGMIYCVARDMTQQKQTEAALRKSEERWQLALRGSNDGIWDWNVQTNEVFFSTRWKTMLGYEEHEISNHLDEWAKRVHPDDLAWVTQAIQDHFAQKTPFYTTEHRVLCKDGTYKWILDRGQAIWDEAGNLLRMAGSHTDVTERRELEAALKRANQELEQRVAERTAQLEQVNAALRQTQEMLQRQLAEIETIYQSAPIGLNVLNTDLRFVRINQRLAQMNGFSVEEHIGRTIRELLPDIANIAEELLRPVLETGEPLLNVELRGETPAQPGVPRVWLESFLPLKDGDRVIGISTVCEEITDRKRVEAALRQSEEFKQRMLESSNDCIKVLDLDGRLLYINPGGQCLLEIDNFESVCNADWIGFWQGDDRVSAQEAIAAAKAGGVGRFQGYCPTAKDTPKWWDVVVTPMQDADGQVIQLLSVSRDITERKRTEEALRQFKLLIELSYEPILVWDLDQGIISWNQGCEQLYGYTREEAIGQSSHKLLQTSHPLSQAEFIAILERDRQWTGELKHTTRTGQQVIVESRQQIIEANGHRLVLETNRDITERKQAEEALRRSEERYRTLFETMEDGFCVIEMLFDENTRPIDYRFLEINPAFEQQSGLQQAVGKTMRQFVPNLEEFWFETYGRVALTGEPVRLENGSDVMNRWFEVYAFPIGQPENHKVAILFKDISERKKVETALRENEDRLRMAISSAQLGTWDWNLVTGELKWDAGCKAMFGLPPDAESNIELFFEGLHPGDRDRLEEIVQVALDPASGGFYDTEYRTVGIQDNVERWLRAKGQAYYDANGKPLRFSGTVLNITEQKQAEAQREQLLRQEQAAREAAERTNRMKDEFLAVLSHELRTPLNPILGWASLLQSPQVSSDKLQQGLRTIERNAKQQVQLIDDLLDISRIVRGKITLNLATVALSDPIAAAVETVHLAAEAKSIGLEVLLDPSVGQVRGDAGRLQQVIWNLLSNAIKFTPTGGQVTVQLTQVDRHAQVQVSDTGKGIKPEFLPHVFELFRQQDSSTTRSFGGLGLGLAIACQVVEAHGGTISAASAGEGQGATFTVQLPLMAVPSLNAPNSFNHQTLNLENLRVAVVDDEVDSLELIKVLLEQEGAIVRAVSLAPEALRVLTQDQFDLLISDIGMPEMDGYTLIRQVRALPPQFNRDIPVIALTAYAGETNRHQILAAGFQAHLAKPIDPKHLLDAIARVITR